MLKKINATEFIFTFNEIWNSPDRRFCFILGAGASKSSGIKTGGELAEIWLREIEERKKGEENSFKIFLEEKNIDTHYPGISYAEIYEERFCLDSESGFENINSELEKARPGYGYSVLAQMLAEKQHNIVITTNFDNLTEEALYTYTSKRPLICGHELLAAFAKPSQKRPLIVKIHRDRFLSPQSLPNEINAINKAWVDALNHIFRISIPVFIGYGGNDGSMMGYLEQVAHFDNIFWCERKGTRISGKVEKFLNDKKGKLVEIEGFDELMFLLQAKLEFPLLNENIKSIAEERANNYRETFEEIQRRTAFSSDIEMKKAAEKIVSDGGNDWWSWELKVMAENDDTNKDRLYRDALTHLPDSPELNGNYALFLKDIGKHDEADIYFKKALKLDPGDANYAGNYAGFLRYCRKSYDEAEKYYKKALELDPYNVNNTGNYAVFLKNVRMSYDDAEMYYARAWDLDPGDANNNSNYAGFLLSRGRKEEADKYLITALKYGTDNDILAEIYFYYYAHFADKQNESFAQLKNQLCQGVRSPHFDLQDNVDKAIQDGHPDPLMLQRLADILTKDAPLGVLCEK